MSVHATATITALTPDDANQRTTVYLETKAVDSTYYEPGSITVSVPFSASLDTFNANILKAVKDWAESMHGWTCPPDHITFVGVMRGSLVLLALA